MVATTFAVLALVIAAASCNTQPKANRSIVVFHTFYFRPVLCQIPRFDPKVTRTNVTESPAALCNDSEAAGAPTTPTAQDSPTASVVDDYYTTAPDRYVLGPADLTSSAIAKAEAIVTSGGQYQVLITFTPSGSAAFDKVAAQRYSYYEENPTNPPYASLEAIELDSRVISAPTIQAAQFNGSAVISGSTSAPFTYKQAETIAGYIEAAAKSVLHRSLSS